MSSKNDVKLGLLIAAAGIVILLGKLGVFGFLGRTLWPLVLLVPGLILHALFFGRRLPASALVPAGILTVYGLLFGICNVWGWDLMKLLWPMLLLGIAIGVYEYGMFSSRRVPGVTAGGAILGVISIVLLFFTLAGSGIMYVVGILLVIAGIWMVAGKGTARSGGKWNRGW